MVAIIKTGHSIRRTFHYNENKVNEGVAELLYAGNYPMELDKMSTAQRLNMLLKTAERNPNISRNSVHISLNFAPGEQIGSDQLKAIATEYMEAIGFGGQPFLVYKHNDAGHPHIHIATTLVNAKGKGIRMQNIGRTLSEKARKQIEERYGLVRAEDHKKGIFQLAPLNVAKIQYGKTDTRRAIAGVLSNILEQYKYTSLNELNAVLNLYHIHADPGLEASRIATHKGLFYRLLDEKGGFIGTPIKASLFHNRPTLTFLEKRFLLNHALRKKHQDRIKNIIDLALKARPAGLKQFEIALKKSAVRLVPRINNQGRLYGITYIDHHNKCVFNGSDLGKSYSANAIAVRLSAGISPVGIKQNEIPNAPPLTIPDLQSSANLLEILMQAEYGTDYIPFALRPKRRKRKRRNKNNT